jgi:nucleotide-binding universal stress UspA family protein
MKAIKTILHPTDFSRPCASALQVACALARDHNAKLVVLHVVPRVEPVEGGDRLAVRRAETREQEQKGYQDEMRSKLEHMTLPNLPVAAERLVAEGPVVREIVRAAKDRGCDTIVMGTHGFTGEARKLLGSIAEEVMQKAPCSVVMVKAEASEE